MTGQAAGPWDDWRAFLGNAISGLHRAAEELRLRRADYEGKTDWFRKGRGRSDVPREESVSVALKELFDLIRAQQQISGTGVQDLDLRHISIQCEVRRPLDPGISARAKPTDLSIVLMKDGELDFRVEAKTVLNDAELETEYFGPRGLKRFEDSGNPYTVQPFGGMVAYVVDADASFWNTRIEASIATEFGSARAGTRHLGGREHAVSRHQVSPAATDASSPIDIEVIHFALEIDASPSRRQ